MYEDAKPKFETKLLHRSGMIDGFNNLEGIIVHFDKRGKVNLKFYVKFFKNSFKKKDNVEISHQLKQQKHNSIFNENNIKIGQRRVRGEKRTIRRLL